MAVHPSRPFAPPAQRVLIVFSRWPHFAQGKRRLAHTVGETAAYRFQRQRLDALRRGIGRDARWKTLWAFSGGGSKFAPSRQVFSQSRGDLGERMQQALHIAKQRMGRRCAVVLIGSDIPAVRADHILEAFALLGRADVVYGPAIDGGFWLVGCSGRRPIPSLFDGVRWSCPDTLNDCRRRLQDLGHWSVHEVACLADVDETLSPGPYCAPVF